MTVKKLNIAAVIVRVTIYQTDSISNTHTETLTQDISHNKYHLTSLIYA